MKKLNDLESQIFSSDRLATEQERRQINDIKRHLSKLSDERFKTGCAHNSLVPLAFLEGMPHFNPAQYHGLLMRPNKNRPTAAHARTVLSIDLGANPLATAVDLNGNVYVAGYGMNGYARSCVLKSSKFQSRIDKKGNALASTNLDTMNRVLAKSTDAKVRNEARSVYHKARQALIDRDPLCKSWKRQAESIKKDMERACAVVREEFATFAALFDVVLIGDNDLRSWHKGISHASSSVLSALSPGKLIKKIKFKIGLAGGQLVEVSEAWSTKLCSCCGALNDPENSATYTCSECGVKMNRDENGARSILILALSRVSLMLGDKSVYPRNPVKGRAPGVVTL
jgi:transposase